ncbi:MAG: hypothetical protein ACREQ9_06685 [Candidatus Binatia bacterium]
MQGRNLFLTILLLSATAAGATQFQAFDRSSQVEASDLILVGRVISTRSGWNEGGGGIHTDAEVAIHEVWKGLPSSERIVVRTPGGIADDVEYAVDGGAALHEGETVVLFLEEDGETYRPFGMTFGKYSVEGSRDGAFLVGNLPPAVTGAQSFEVVSIVLEDLRREVEAILEGDRR